MKRGRLHKDQILVHDSWVSTELYDIEAKTDGHPSHAEMHLMFQKVLTERFQLRLERQHKEGPFYALVLDRSGIKMLRHDPQNVAMFLSPTNRIRSPDTT